MFDATLGMGVDGLQDGVGVWAVVEKGFMRDIRQKRWDLVSMPHCPQPAVLTVYLL